MPLVNLLYDVIDKLSMGIGLDDVIIRSSTVGNTICWILGGAVIHMINKQLQ